MCVSARSGFRSGAIFGLLFMWFLSLSACVVPGPQPPPPPPANKAQLRLVHASPDAPAVDIYIQGQSTPLFKNLRYGDATNYASLNAGSYVLEVRNTGASPTSTPLFRTASLKLQTGQIYTAVASGLVGATGTDERFRILLLQETWSAPGAGYARIRFVHASPDAPALNVDLNDDGTIDVNSLGRFQSTTGNGLLVPSGQKIQVSLRTSSGRLTGFTLPALVSGDRVFAIITGRNSLLPREAGSLSILLVGKSKNYGFVRQNPQTWFVHASPDAGSVDLWLGSRKVIDDLMFGELSGPLQIPPGSLSLAVYPHIAGSTRPSSGLLHTVNLSSLAAGDRYLVVIMGFEDETGALGLTSRAYREAFSLDPSSPRLRAIHAAPDAPEIDVGIYASGAFTPIAGLAGLAFTEASDPAGVTVPTGTVELAIAPTGTTSPLASFSSTFAAGQRVFGIIGGALHPESYEQPLNLIVVNTAVQPWTVTVYPDRAF